MMMMCFDFSQKIWLALFLRNGKLDILTMFFHRYLRLTPLLAACILISTSIVRFLGHGPLWVQRFTFIKGRCQRYWWSALLYVQNYTNVNERVSILQYSSYFPFLPWILPNFVVNFFFFFVCSFFLNVFSNFNVLFLFSCIKVVSGTIKLQ